MLKNYKNIFLGLGFLMIQLPLWGQTASEAWFWSQEYPILTTRSMGMAGELLVGDPSNMAYNPAGLVELEQVELVANIRYGIYDVDEGQGNSYGRSIDGEGSMLSLQGVLPFQRSKSKGKWKRLTLGFGLDYQDRNTVVLLRAPSNTLFQNALQQATGQMPDALDPYTAGLLYNADFLQHDGNGNYSLTTEEIRATYLLNEYVWGSTQLGARIALAGDYGDRLSWGISMQWSHVSGGYGHSNSYDTIGGGHDLGVDFWEGKRILGWKLETQLGALYRLTDRLQLGATFYLPSFNWLREDYSVFLSWTSIEPLQWQADSRPTPVRQRNYVLYTPWRFQLSGAWTLGSEKQSSVQFSTGYQHMPGVRLSQADEETAATNAVLQGRHQGIWHIGVGAEWAIKFLRLRAGGRLESPAYGAALGINPWRSMLTAGLGCSWNRFYFDLGFAYQADYYIVDEYANGWNTGWQTGQLWAYQFQASVGVRLGKAPVALNKS